MINAGFIWPSYWFLETSGLDLPICFERGKAVRLKSKKSLCTEIPIFWNRKLWVFSPNIRTWLMDILVWSLTYRNNFLNGIWVAWVNVSAKIRNLSWCLRLNCYWDSRFSVFPDNTCSCFNKKYGFESVLYLRLSNIFFFYSLQNFQLSNACFLPYPECWANDKGLLVTS